MIDTAVGEPPDLSTVPGGWRARLEEFVRQLAGVWQQHPWIPAVTVGSRVMGPREAGWIESAVAALAGTGLTGDERLAAVFLLFGHVRNTHSMATAGTQPWSGGSELAEQIRGHAELFPELSQALAHHGQWDSAASGQAARRDDELFDERRPFVAVDDLFDDSPAGLTPPDSPFDAPKRPQNAPRRTPNDRGTAQA